MFHDVAERAAKLLPLILRDESNTMKNFNIRIENKKGTKPVLTVCVGWEGKDMSSMEKWSKLMEKGDDDEPVYLTCDGACEKRMLADKLRHFGRCEHNICEECLKNAPKDLLFPKEHSCPSRDCLVSELVEVAIDEEADNCSSVNGVRSPAFQLAELIYCKIYLFEKSSHGVARRKLTEEWNSTTSLDAIRAHFESFSDLKIKSLLYCCGPIFARRQLSPLPSSGDLLLSDIVEEGHGQMIFFAGYGMEI